MIGSYNTTNMLAAACAGKAFSVPLSHITEAIEEYIPDNNRSQLKKTNYNTLLLDAYNANPSSMEASIQNFSDLKADHKIVILGEMLELGEVSKYEHEKLLNQVVSLGFEQIFLVGNCPVSNKDCTIFTSTKGLSTFLASRTLKGKTILIKGSRGNRLETIVEYL
jgi:UDP-N-acetylmuramoyl-tripeptide--D-alanyl-D-alanine ligase